MIYLDTSVALAELLAEERRAPRAVWQQPLISSRLLEYELFVRINARKLAGSHGPPARRLLEQVSLVELNPLVLQRALEPFPVPVRTLDALHLATMVFLKSQGVKLRLATFDRRQQKAAAKLQIPVAFRI